MPSPKRPSATGQSALDFGFSAPAPTAEPAASKKTEGPEVFSVSQVVRAASRAMEARFSDVWVEGEISNLSQPRSGHMYFTLKDAESQLSSVIWRSGVQRLKFRVEDGLKVRARGKLSIYDAQGKFQMYVDKLEPAGMGALQLAFEQLKERLQKEGLFDADKKRALPPWPRRIGLVTSATGAAVRDILHVAARRGRVRVLISPCQVQGDDAPRDILRAFLAIQAQPEIDVIIIGRGGGSAEDLAAFNDEALARAIRVCPVPVVSAVGHEVDFTIADFVADLRAPTPSAAAELVVAEWLAAREELDDVELRLSRAGARVIADARQRLDDQVARAATALERQLTRRRRALSEQGARLATLHPRARLAKDRARLVDLERRMTTRMRSAVEQRRRAFSTLAGKLDVLSPLGVLSRGYSLVRDDKGHVVSDAAQVKRGDDVTVRLNRGQLRCRVESGSDGDG